MPVTPGPRKYATLLNDDTTKPLIIEMLGELMRLQKRAIDDKNAKARRRLVMGFREVARGVRARKVKLVVSPIPDHWTNLTFLLTSFAAGNGKQS